MLAMKRSEIDRKTRPVFARDQYELLDSNDLGEMALAAPVRSCPIFIYMSFRGDGQIRVMTIAAIDLQPLTEAIRSAAQTATAKVS